MLGMILVKTAASKKRFAEGSKKKSLIEMGYIRQMTHCSEHDNRHAACLDYRNC